MHNLGSGLSTVNHQSRQFHRRLFLTPAAHTPRRRVEWKQSNKEGTALLVAPKGKANDEEGTSLLAVHLYL